MQKEKKSKYKSKYFSELASFERPVASKKSIETDAKVCYPFIHRRVRTALFFHLFVSYALVRLGQSVEEHDLTEGEHEHDVPKEQHNSKAPDTSLWI